MTGFIRCSILITMLGILILMMTTDQAMSVSKSAFMRSNEKATNGKPTPKHCNVNGVMLRHRSMKYYKENSYVSCFNGKAGCYRIERMHDNAKQVTCPTYNLQQQIDKEAVTRLHRKKRKEKEAKDRRLSLVVASVVRIWESGVICYQFNDQYLFHSTQLEFIYMAMRIYETSTNVRFMDKETCTKEGTSYCNSCANWVDFKHPTSGRDCNSSIGITDKGAQIMNLADRCFEVDDDLKTVYGSAMHEIGHSAGLYHEHQHPQRTIVVMWDAIDQSRWSEMMIRDISIGGYYDPNSVMHYPKEYGFCQPNYCNDELQTNCAKKGTVFCNLNDDDCMDITENMCNTTATDAIGQRKGLSVGDVAAINELYPSAAWPLSFTKVPPSPVSSKEGY